MCFCSFNAPNLVIALKLSPEKISDYLTFSYLYLFFFLQLLATGTEHFNSKPKKGIQFLQEHNLMSNPVDPKEVVNFLRENPHLDKKMIGEYISNRANLNVLDSFVK